MPWVGFLIESCSKTRQEIFKSNPNVEVSKINSYKIKAQIGEINSSLTSMEIEFMMGESFRKNQKSLLGSDEKISSLTFVFYFKSKKFEDELFSELKEVVTELFLFLDQCNANNDEDKCYKQLLKTLKMSFFSNQEQGSAIKLVFDPFLAEKT